jgi:Exonuclease
MAEEQTEEQTGRRPIVVVDTETNGLDPERHQVVEVAWWNLDTGERGEFVPQHDVSEVLAAATLKALQVNHYVDRIADRAGEDATGHAQRLYQVLTGATLLGANVATLDAPMLTKLFAGIVFPHADPAPWHYRIWEIGPYAAGVLGLDHVPGMWELSQLLGTPEPDHSAAQDVTATGEAFLRLREMRAGYAPVAPGFTVEQFTVAEVTQ